jgi:hypothetical protein
MKGLEDTMMEWKVNNVNKGASLIYLIYEDAFEEEAYSRIIQSTHDTQPVFIEFWLKFTVKKKQRHYRALLEVLPAALISNLATLTKSKPTSNGPKSQQEQAPVVQNDKHRNSPPTKEPHDLNLLKHLRILVAEDNLVNQHLLGINEGGRVLLGGGTGTPNILYSCVLTACHDTTSVLQHRIVRSVQLITTEVE